MLSFLKNYFLPDDKKKTVSKPAAKPEMTAASAAQLIQNQDPLERKSAIAALDDLTVLADRASNDGDTQVKAAALARLKSLLLQTSKPLAERQRTLGVLDADTLEYVASQAKELALRQAALERINRVGFLGDRALADPDAATRLALVARIDAEATLNRLVQQSRTKDKAVFRAAKDKLERARELSGDTQLFNERALALCVQVDQLIKTQPSNSAASLSEINAAWSKLANKASPALQARFLAAQTTMDHILHPPAPIAQSLDNEEPTAIVIRSGLDLELADLLRRLSEQPASVSTEQLEGLQKQWQRRYTAIDPSADDQTANAQFASMLGDARARIRQQHDALEQQAQEYRQALKKLSALIEAGDMKAAKAAETTLPALSGPVQALLSPADKRLAGDCKAKLGKLLAWERWGSREKRTALCDEVEALIGNGMHPDALANKIKDAQTAWKKLDELEGLNEEQAKELGIGKRFRAICFKALEPAKGYFDKRREVRGIKKEATEELLARMVSVLSAEDASSKDLLDAKADLNEHMRALDELEPKARAEMGKRMRELRDQFNAVIDGKFSEAETAKKKLLAALRRDLIGADSFAAVSAAKNAQAQWKTLPRAGRKVEDDLWKELRDLVDPHFEKMKQASADAHAEESARLAKSDALIQEMRALVEQANADHSVNAEIERIESAWRAHLQVEEPKTAGNDRGFDRDDRAGFERKKADPKAEQRKLADRAKEREFDAAIAQVNAAITARESTKEKIRNDAAQQKASLCLELENAWLGAQKIDVAALRERWSGLTKLAAADEKAITERFERAISGCQNTALPDDSLLDHNAKLAGQLAMAFEYLSGKPSPEALKAERMQYQVQRLGEKLSSGAKSASSELQQIQLQWLALGPLRSVDRTAIAARMV
jgi:DNA repair protein SbcC/Rad50